MTTPKRRTKEYLEREKVRCPRCHHHGRDIKFRPKLEKTLCNNCASEVRCNVGFAGKDFTF